MLETLKNLVDPRNWLARWHATDTKVKAGLVLVGACLVYVGAAHLGWVEGPSEILKLTD